MVKKGEEKSGIIKRADAGAAAKAYKVLVKKYNMEEVQICTRKLKKLWHLD